MVCRGVCRYETVQQIKYSFGKNTSQKRGLLLNLTVRSTINRNEAINDRIRTERLENLNRIVLRIPNNEIDDNFAEICDHIDSDVNQIIAE